MRGASLARLVEIMDRLLAPDGCAWDREQTLITLRAFLIEESYEVLEAIDRDDPVLHREELGDLLMQVVFQSALRQRDGHFDIDQVVEGICDKLVRRHPHVFAAEAEKLDDSSKVLAQWERIKAAEKPAGTRVLDGVTQGLPALAFAQKLGSKASRVGFDWPSWEGSAAKIEEEVAEVREVAQSGDADGRHHEIGDLLFATVNLARKLGVDAEVALRDASRRFQSRFEHIEDHLATQGRHPRDASLEELDALWDRAKIELAGLSKK
ncbi:MAG TPA: nucleoside triphosphate pyrophosphohydrolase [Kofleriaceae bacterium]|nr:nucleoside triphosphate pyrophosphohydrolase [Kofleriaceae bacterium]